MKVAAQKVHAKAAAHAKTATAVAVMDAMLKVATPKVKPPSTTTPPLKPKPKPVPKRVTNAWHARSVAKHQKAATTHANPAVNVRSVVSVVSVENAAKAKAAASAAHAVNATKVAANVPRVWTKTAILKHCL